MRMKIAGLAAVLLLAGAAACGGDENNAADPEDVPGVDASGTADTEIFTDSPDTAGVPVAGHGGTPAGGAPAGGGGAAGTTP
jgi:ABC-type glycerol-3-phosphate transport system substrate-binding protein